MGLVLNQGPDEDSLVTVQKTLEDFFSTPGVIAKFSTQEGRQLPTVGLLGWREREQVINQRPDTGANRVLVLPGHGLGDTRQHGSLKLGPNRNSGNARSNNPRTEALWTRKFTLSCWAVDPCNTSDQARQISAATNLLEVVVSALTTRLGAQVDFAGEVYQDKFSLNFAFGVELLLPMTVATLLFGLPRDTITEVSPVVNKEVGGS